MIFEQRLYVTFRLLRIPFAFYNEHIHLSNFTLLYLPRNDVIKSLNMSPEDKTDKEHFFLFAYYK